MHKESVCVLISKVFKRSFIKLILFNAWKEHNLHLLASQPDEAGFFITASLYMHTCVCIRQSAQKMLFCCTLCLQQW